MCTKRPWNETLSRMTPLFSNQCASLSFLFYFTVHRYYCTNFSARTVVFFQSDGEDGEDDMHGAGRLKTTMWPILGL